MTDRKVEFAAVDPASREMLERLGLALFLSAVARERRALLAAAQALCVDNMPPQGLEEAQWLSDLRELQSFLRAWERGDGCGLEDLILGVPPASGVHSIAELDEVLDDAISESDRIIRLAADFDVSDLHVIEKAPAMLEMRAAADGPYISAAFQDGAAAELSLYQAVGSRPTSARLKLGAAGVITFSEAGLALLEGEQARHAWGVLLEAQAEPGLRGVIEGVTRKLTALTLALAERVVGMPHKPAYNLSVSATEGSERARVTVGDFFPDLSPSDLRELLPWAEPSTGLLIFAEGTDAPGPFTYLVSVDRAVRRGKNRLRIELTTADGASAVADIDYYVAGGHQRVDSPLPAPLRELLMTVQILREP